MDITILICTHNRSRSLIRTLDYIYAASRPPGTNVKVMVVANACSDDTVSSLERYQHELSKKSDNSDQLELAWVEEPTTGKSQALNTAIPLLTGDIIALVDDDHRVDQQYLVEIVNASEAYPDATMFCGRIIPDWDGSEPAWVHDRGPYRIYPLPVPRFDHGDRPYQIELGGAVPGGGNLFLRRVVFDRVGKFSTSLGPSGHNLLGGEDSDFVLRALRNGESLYYVPNVVQYHYVDSDRLRLGYLMRKSYQRTRVTTRIASNPQSRVPVYMWRKLGSNFLRLFTSLDYQKFRFYSVRLAATAGEMRGTLDAREPENTETVSN